MYLATQRWVTSNWCCPQIVPTLKANPFLSIQFGLDVDNNLIELSLENQEAELWALWQERMHNNCLLFCPYHSASVGGNAGLSSRDTAVSPTSHSLTIISIEKLPCILGRKIMKPIISTIRLRLAEQLVLLDGWWYSCCRCPSLPFVCAAG